MRVCRVWNKWKPGEPSWYRAFILSAKNNKWRARTCARNLLRCSESGRSFCQALSAETSSTWKNCSFFYTHLLHHFFPPTDKKAFNSSIWSSATFIIKTSFFFQVSPQGLFLQSGKSQTYNYHYLLRWWCTTEVQNNEVKTLHRGFKLVVAPLTSSLPANRFVTSATSDAHLHEITSVIFEKVPKKVNVHQCKKNRIQTILIGHLGTTKDTRWHHATLLKHLTVVVNRCKSI